MIPGQKFLTLLRDIAADKRLAFMLLLGFSAGLPFLLIYSTPSIWFTEAGFSEGVIGLTYYATVAYSFKFAWAPLLDRFDPPFLSRSYQRWRGWLLLAQGTITIGLLGVAASNPSAALWPTVAFTTLIAIAGASQDIVIDGWRINVMPADRQGVMLACYQLGYRFGLIAGGVGALFVVYYAGWHIAYCVMALLMLLGIAATLWAPDPDRLETPIEISKPTAPAKVNRIDTVSSSSGRRLPPFMAAYEEPLADLFRRFGQLIVPILLLVALFRLPDYLSGVMANPLYTKLGFNVIEIATVTKVYGIPIALFAAFVGGISITWLGLMPTLIIGGIAGAASNLALAALATRGGDFTFFTIAVGAENFAGSFAGTALMAYMSSLTSRTYAATQYALLSSLYALPGKLVGGLSGFLVMAWGYPTFLTSTALIGLPIVALSLLIWWRETRRTAAAT
ncbi:AmpG family muropeptide MFS transporter [Labrys sp. ZIDIC5]|uniref:AmpG family muropeptide MFS transporter n=1 Tax=Labrys sedimenti TaxID=3106036 RepID=UPI002ACA596A|nr:MFS transporter [Labrys sp. ZIDIC5]MDZ5448726.1 MFS transporter [Labrys sp. ZIDIC5]